MAVAATPPRSVAITHKIVDGDTLEALAEVHLGSRSRWTEIYNANPEILDNPEVLPLGVTIVILPGIRPSRPANSPETEALVPVLGSDLLKFRNAID
jgi:nucleoid-associated protein YgaU